MPGTPSNANPSVSVYEVVQLALPPGSTIIAGHEGLSRNITWARLLRTRPTGGFEIGDVLLLPREVLAIVHEPRVRVRLVRELIEAGAAALVLADAADAAVCETCEAAGMPLVQLPAGSSLQEVERAIITLILDRDAQLHRRADEVYGRLLAAMLGDEGLGTLLAALAAATGLRCAVLDDYGNLQAIAPRDEVFEAALAVESERILLRESAAGESRALRPLFLRLRHQAVNWSGHCYPLQIGSTLAGYLALLASPSHLSELDRLIAERATTLVALEVAKQRAVAEASQRWRGEFLDDLIEGNFSSGESALARAQQLGHELVSDHATVILAAELAPDQQIVGEQLVSAVRHRRRFAEIARSALLRTEPRTMTVERDGALVALMPIPGGAAAGGIGDLVDRVRRDIGRALPELHISAGISRAIVHPLAFGDAYLEARQALGIAQKLLGGNQTLEFARVGVERLLFRLLGDSVLEDFARDLLGRLLAYDTAHRGELVHTLDVFLRCNGNHVRAAQELHLHRNTLLYRLERAREILVRDLDDADTRLALQVALRIRGVLADEDTQPVGTRGRVAGRRKRAG